jgi:hypothetical protein
MNEQTCFDFSADPEREQGHQDGLELWRAEHHARMEKLARRQGLPLGHRVRVELDNGEIMEGLLFLQEEQLFPQDNRAPRLLLRIHSNVFSISEISSCVRLEGG